MPTPKTSMSPLDAILQSGDAAAVDTQAVDSMNADIDPTVAPALDIAPPSIIADAPVIDDGSPPTPPANKPIVVKHTKTHDEIAETIDGIQTTKKVPRKYRSFHVIPHGAASTTRFGNGRVVAGVLDESEAKQVFYNAFGCGHAPSKFPVKVVPYTSTNATPAA
jgi:hypothetical protein